MTYNGWEGQRTDQNQECATDVFKENLEDTTSLFIDETRNTLDTSTTGKTTDCGLGYAYVK